MDVVGAGDSFLAGMVSNFLSSENDPTDLQMADWGNVCSAVRVRKFGDLRVGKEEFRAAL